MSIASAICTARVRKGLSQRALARQLGCSHVYLSRVETGAVGVSPEQAARLALALDADPADFVRQVLQERLDAAGVALTVLVQPSREMRP